MLCWRSEMQVLLFGAQRHSTETKNLFRILSAHSEELRKQWFCNQWLRTGDIFVFVHRYEFMLYFTYK